MFFYTPIKKKFAFKSYDIIEELWFWNHGNSENVSMQTESTARVKIKMGLRNMAFLLVIILSLKIQVEIYFGCFFCYFDYVHEIVVHVFVV